MSHCARKQQKRSFGHVLHLLAFALAVFLGPQRCSAGLTGLNLLPHEQLHKGRGISEEYNTTVGTVPSQKNASQPLQNRTGNGRVPAAASAEPLQQKNTSLSAKKIAGISKTSSRPSEEGIPGRSASSQSRNSPKDGKAAAAFSGEALPGRNTSSRPENVTRDEELLNAHLPEPLVQNSSTQNELPVVDDEAPAAESTEPVPPERNITLQIQDATASIEALARSIAAAAELLPDANIDLHLLDGLSKREAEKQPVKRTVRNLSPLPPPAPRSMRLDIVLSHFHPDRVDPALDFWLDFLERAKVQQWKPFVWLYCQNENMSEEDMQALQPLLRYGGQVVHLPNIGRESHSFLNHIIGHYGDLADYTLFSQDIPEPVLVDRFEKMFSNATGFLPLSMVGHVDCKDEWLPPGAIPQLYSMLTRSLCPPEGFTASFQGQFIVSRTRILDQNWWVYKNLLDVLAAPLDHWVHGIHDNEHYKDTSNPFFGHVLERAWSLAFNCFESWRHGNCWWCENDMHMENCGTDACQCLDHVPE